MAATMKTRTLYPSLFGPDSEEEGSEGSASDGEAQERPLFLPLDDAINEPPKTFASLLEILLPRISPRPDLKSVSIDDQQSFVNILVGELASQFPLLQHQIDDPFLNDVQNGDLHRKVYIQVCLVLEKLYSQYVAMASTLTKNGIFSVPANMSRLKAQLMLQANKSLDIPAIRRSVIAQLRGPPPTHLSPPQLPLIFKHEKWNPSAGTDDIGLGDPLSKKLLKLGVNPQSVTRDAYPSNVTDKELKSQVPRPLGTSSPITTTAGAIRPTEGDDRTGPLQPSDGDGSRGHVQPFAVEESLLRVQSLRSSSMPNLEENFLLLGQGVDKAAFRKMGGGSHATAKLHFWGTKRALSVESIMDLKMDTPEHVPEVQEWIYEHTLLGRLTNTEIDKDLKRLCNEWTTSSNPEDLDPLLQAQAHALSKKQADRLTAAQRRVARETVCLSDVFSGSHEMSVGKAISVREGPKPESGDHLDVLGTSRCEDGGGAMVGGDTMDRRGAQTQPSVITSLIGETLTRTSDIRVSERGPLTSLRLKPLPPVYNELTGELEPSVMKDLDQNLNEGRDLMVLYEEVLRALPKHHLDFMRESQLEPTITNTVKLSKVLASETLQHRKSRRVVNCQLHQSIRPPWEVTNMSRKVWEESQPYQRPQDEKGDRACSSQMKNRGSSHNLRYSHGRTLFDTQDYFKFVSKQATDYLGLIYHLYDSDGTDSETEEEEKARRQQLAELHHRLKVREAKRKQQYELKSNYKAGQWNVNAVMMGGLGGDPDLSSSDEELENATLTKKGTNAEKTVQEKLCIIWNRLHFLPAQQMDMAIKYSSAEFSGHLNTALDTWECACAAIEKREQVLMELQSFEKAASDPARFFAKGHLGSSVARLEEAKHRDRLHQELDHRDREVAQVIHKVLCEYGDRVSYNGRSYQEKMANDRTEMLYWLQQERRREVLRPTVKTLHIEVPSLQAHQLS